VEFHEALKANWFGLLRNNIGLLAPIRSRVDGFEGDTTPRASRYARTAHDKWLRLELVLDLSKVGAIIGIVHVECLEVINMEVATRNG
jgi:hypothetical protein